MPRSGRGVRTVAVVLMMAGLGCGGGSSGGGSGSPATAEAFCEQSNAIYGPNSLRCAGGTAADWSSNAHCVAIGMAKANIQFDAAAAKDCLATIQTDAATMCNPQPDCLAQVQKGLVPDGQPCTLNEECASAGSFCMSADDTTCAPLLCTGPSPVGAQCGPLGCVAGAGCDTTKNLCVPEVFGDVGATCSFDPTMQCKDGLDCVYIGNDATGTCQTAAPPPPSSGCTTDDDCDTFFEYCDTTCKPRLPVGQPCTDHPTACQLLSVCDPVTNRCSAAGHPGQPCGGFTTPSSIFAYCATGFCDATDPKAPVCAAYKKLGAACTAGAECESGVCHNSVCTDCPR